jgi:hypothetical protein
MNTQKTDKILKLQGTDEEGLRKLFVENHLEFQESNGDQTGKKGDWNYSFSNKKNLIIGTNGSGKRGF